MKLAIGIGLVLLLGSSPAMADLLEPVEGGRLRVPATIDGDRVLLETPDGIVAFPRSDFREILPEPCPSRDWPAIKAKAMTQGASGRLSAAFWALDRGLVPEAEAMIRAAHEADPHHEPASRMAKVLDRLAKPVPDPDLPPLLVHLPNKFATARGPHVLLLHEHSPAEAAERIDVLERVVKSYYLTFAALGFDLPEPSRKLPSAWFAARGDYLAYLRAEGVEAFANTRGYHHPTRGLVVSYDGRSDPEWIAAKARLVEKRSRAATSSIEGLSRRWDREEIALNLDRREIDLAVAAHETAHQLVAVSGLAPGPESFPNWLDEGLAMQFEAIEAGRWAGLGRPSTIRLADYGRIHPSPPLIPILRDAGYGRGYHQDLYAKAWALTYFLRTESPQEFVAFLDALRVPSPPDEPAEARFERAFMSAITGSATEFEARWHRTMNTMAARSIAESRPRKIR